MGTFYVTIELGDVQGANWRTLDALVDTGASTTSVPASVLRQLGVRPLYTERFRFAQGEVREMPVGETRIRLAGKSLPLSSYSTKRELPRCWARWPSKARSWLSTRSGRG